MNDTFGAVIYAAPKLVIVTLVTWLPVRFAVPRACELDEGELKQFLS